MTGKASEQASPATTSAAHPGGSLPLAGLLHLGVTYVNPVVAVALGWFFLSEPVTWWTVAGTSLILAGVAGVFRDRRGG